MAYVVQRARELAAQCRIDRVLHVRPIEPHDSDLPGLALDGLDEHGRRSRHGRRRV